MSGRSLLHPHYNGKFGENLHLLPKVLVIFDLSFKSWVQDKKQTLEKEKRNRRKFTTTQQISSKRWHAAECPSIPCSYGLRRSPISRVRWIWRWRGDWFRSFRRRRFRSKRLRRRWRRKRGNGLRDLNLFKRCTRQSNCCGTPYFLNLPPPCNG